jgi:hypothetical protein
MDCNRKRKVVGIVGGEPVAIHSSGQTVFSLSHTEGRKEKIEGMEVK